MTTDTISAEIIPSRHHTNRSSVTDRTIEVNIPDFKGDVYDERCKDYNSKRQQYALSTHGEEMKPKYIAYPLDDADVQVAIKYATKEGLKVMARSGGHQYCGVSCDTGALILSMDNFKILKMKTFEPFNAMGPDGTIQTVSTVVHVGVGNRLKDMVDYFVENGIAVPHGECPSVGIGGHTQTGGYGHLMRSFGLCIDYVYGFTIVTADGTIQVVNRESTDKTKKDLYWAVLGGSQGAFGVTTNIIFHPILDKDYPSSTGLLHYHRYTENKAKNCLKIFQAFCNKCKEDLPTGIDLMMSIGTNNTNLRVGLLMEPSLIIFEMVCKAMTDKDNRATPEYEEFNKLKDDFDKFVNLNLNEVLTETCYQAYLANIIPRLDGKKHCPISKLNQMFTRKRPLVIGADGSSREGQFPYVKATYGGDNELSDNFVEDFSKLIDDVNKEESLHLVVQVGAGGGAYERYAGKTASPQRKSRYFFTFDIFRQDEDKDLAQEYHNRFVTDIVEKYFANHPKKMLQWASSPDHLDMSVPEVWKMYYDNEEHFHALCKIKTNVDPDDLFHSRITIRPNDKKKKKRSLFSSQWLCQTTN